MTKIQSIIQKIIKEESYIIEKAWKSYPIGTVVTRKDGKKYRKVSNNGTEKDWVIEKQDKQPSKEDSNKDKTNAKEDVKNLTSKELDDYAKNSSATALENSIKNSPDPDIREVANKELDRRDKEEKVQEEKPNDINKKESESKGKSSILNSLDSIIEKTKEDYRKISEEAINSKFEDYSVPGLVESRIQKQNKIAIFLNVLNEYKSQINNDDNYLSEEQILKILKIKDLKSLIGDGNVIYFRATQSKIYDNKISLGVVTEDCVCERTLDLEKGKGSMDFLMMNPSKSSSGKGAEIFYNQIKQFQKLGIKILSTHAAKGDNFNGYYTWARLGYTIEKYEEQRNHLINLLKNDLDPELNKVNNLETLMSTEKGRKWWKEWGFEFHGSFNLEEGSYSMNTINNYMDERKSKDKK